MTEQPDQSREIGPDEEWKCPTCGGECRITPTWDVSVSGPDLWIGDTEFEEDRWRIPRRAVMYVELSEQVRQDNSAYVLVYVHTRYGRHRVHACGDLEHAKAMRQDIVGCLGWLD